MAMAAARRPSPSAAAPSMRPTWRLPEITYVLGNPRADRKHKDSGAPDRPQSPPQPVWDMCFEGHTHWVNDVLLCPVSGPSSGLLVSASSDTTVKLWSTESGECKETLRKHKDYVQAISLAESITLVASAGLDKTVYCWDIVTGKDICSIPEKDSLYCLDVSCDGHSIVAGGPHKDIGIHDPRTGTKTGKLRGHSDIVRVVRLNKDGTLCLSGGVDSSVKLWDMGTQKCLHTFDFHSDSVWSIAVADDFSYAVSGGRDGNVICLDLSLSAYGHHGHGHHGHGYSHTRRERECDVPLVCSLKTPVLSVLLDESAAKDTHSGSGSGLGFGFAWVSTTDSDVACWKMPSVAAIKGVPSSSASASASASASTGLAVPSQMYGEKLTPRSGHRGSIGMISPRMPLSPRVHSPNRPVSAMPFTPQLASAPHSAKPVLRIEGVAGIVKYSILNDRQHVVTKDCSGCVAKWNLLNGTVEEYGVRDFDSVVAEVDTVESILSWFSLDTIIGSLSIHLDSRRVFSADMYASDLGLVGDGPDSKANLGAIVLNSLFREWVKRKEGKAGSDAKTMTPGGEREVEAACTEGGAEAEAEAVVAIEVEAEAEAKAAADVDVDDDAERVKRKEEKRRRKEEETAEAVGAKDKEKERQKEEPKTEVKEQKAKTRGASKGKGSDADADADADVEAEPEPRKRKEKGKAKGEGKGKDKTDDSDDEADPAAQPEAEGVVKEEKKHGGKTKGETEKDVSEGTDEGTGKAKSKAKDKPRTRNKGDGKAENEAKAKAKAEVKAVAVVAEEKEDSGKGGDDGKEKDKRKRKQKQKKPDAEHGGDTSTSAKKGQTADVDVEAAAEHPETLEDMGFKPMPAPDEDELERDRGDREEEEEGDVDGLLSRSTTLMAFEVHPARCLWRTTIKGLATADVDVPSWVADCVLHGVYTVTGSQKITFCVHRIEGDHSIDELPVAQQRLTAHRLLVMPRVAAYILKILKLDLHVWDKDKQAERERENQAEPTRPYIELSVCGKVVPLSINLATARQFYWNSGDEMVIEYRIVDGIDLEDAQDAL